MECCSNFARTDCRLFGSRFSYRRSKDRTGSLPPFPVRIREEGAERCEMAFVSGFLILNQETCGGSPDLWIWGLP